MLTTAIYKNSLAANIASNIALSAAQQTTLNVKRTKRLNVQQQVILAQSSKQAKQLAAAKKTYMCAIVTIQQQYVNVHNIAILLTAYTTAIQSAKNTYFAAKTAILAQSTKHNNKRVTALKQAIFS